jgi:hypothetical protein
MLTISACVALAAVAQAASAQEDVGEEIRRLRRELMQVQEERSRTQEEIVKDKEDFGQYRKRALQRMRKIRHETDSIRQVIVTFTGKRDSLDGLVAGVKAGTKQYVLLQDGFRRELVVACDSLLVFAERLPPTGQQKAVSAIGLLKTELTTKSVDNVESVTRLLQIARDMHEVGAGLQIVQGTSPVPEIRGTTYRIRVGAFFEAVVNAAGTQAAVWTGYDENGNPQWRAIDDVTVSSQVLKAVNVREGKSLPALVQLPMTDVGVVTED